MEVRHKEKALNALGVRSADTGADGAAVVAEMKRTGRVDAG